MYIKKTDYQNTDPVYTITELEVVEDYPTEIRDLFIKAFVEAQNIVKTIWEEEVEFDVEDYFTKEDIELLEHRLPSTEGEWTVLDIKILLGDL